MKRTILSLMLLVASLASLAYDAEIDGIYYNLDSKAKTATVVHGNKEYTGSVNIPSVVTFEGVQYDVKSIGYWAFIDCADLTAVTIPNSVTHIEEEAFSHCSGLTSLTIPNSVTNIGLGAFAWCSGLTSVTIGNSVTLVEYGAFLECSNIKELIYADGCTTAFGIDVTSITSVVIPNSVTSIGDEAFFGCFSLTSVTIPNSVTSIGYRSFEGCSGLTSLIIGNSVTSIDEMGFRGCSGLKEIQSLATIPPSCVSATFEDVDNFECILKVPEKSIDAYRAADEWKDFRNIVALEEDPSAIGGINSSSNATPVDYISTNGYRSNRAHKGINIIRMSDGSVRKVIAQ